MEQLQTENEDAGAQSRAAEGGANLSVGLEAFEFGADIKLAGMTATDKKQLMKMLHIEGEFCEYNINTVPIGVLKAMAHAVRYGRIQGAKHQASNALGQEPCAAVCARSPGPDRWKQRSRTFHGISAAMAEQ